MLWLALICCSCSSIKKTNVTDSPCVENLKFKDEFVRRLNIIDDFMSIESREFKDIDELERVITEQKIADFKSSLLFISQYTSSFSASAYTRDAGFTFGFYYSPSSRTLTYENAAHLGIGFGVGESTKIVLPIGQWLDWWRD